MNGQHFRAFLWLRWRLRVNQTRRGGMVNTILLLGAATVLIVLLGIGLGALAAARRGSNTDSKTVFTSLLFWSLPTFWTGLILGNLMSRGSWGSRGSGGFGGSDSGDSFGGFGGGDSGGGGASSDW